MNKKRGLRKKEHIKYSMLLRKKMKNNLFDDIEVLHNCLSEVNFNNIDLTTNLQNMKLTSPIIINAMTGGMKEGEYINQELAKIAKKLNLAMAVGSQTIALKNPSSINSFRIVREINPNGIIFANLGSDATVKEAFEAIDIIEADALQIHLNTPQELIMKEGRRNFAGTLDNIIKIMQHISIPVIIKEVGFGIAKEEALILAEIGVNIVDISGAGGTNFIAIESLRNKLHDTNHFETWGIPTPISLIEVVKSVGNKIDIISSGGLTNGLDAAKSLALGAKATAFAGCFLCKLLEKGPSFLEKYILRIEKEIKYTMAFVGATNFKELRQRPIVIRGKTYDWLKYRGIDI